MGQKFGQHFLTDTTVLERTQVRIQELIDLYNPERLIEIGPGQGALTRYLFGLEGSHRLTVIETDERLQSALTSGEFIGLDVVWGDVLQTGFEQFGDSWMVVGNLPYYITSPIFVKCFGKEPREGENASKSACFGGVFLIQREVALKVDTYTKKKSYLGRCIQYAYDIQYEFTVGPECFNPPPKVDSAVISVKRRLGKNGNERTFSYGRLIDFLNIVSQYTRKTLGKISKMRSEDFDSLGVVVPDHLRSARVEALSRDEMAELLTVLE